MIYALFAYILFIFTIYNVMYALRNTVVLLIVKFFHDKKCKVWRNPFTSSALLLFRRQQKDHG